MNVLQFVEGFVKSLKSNYEKNIIIEQKIKLLN